MTNFFIHLIVQILMRRNIEGKITTFNSMFPKLNQNINIIFNMLQNIRRIYVIKFDFQDWDNPDSLYKDMVYVLDQLNKKRESGEIDMTTLVVHLVHYMD